MTTETTLTPPEDTAASPSGRSAFGRIAGVSGIAFAVAIILSQFLVGEMPGAGDDVTAVREYFEDGRGSHEAGLVVVALAVVPFILFVTGLMRSQRRSEGVGGWGSTAVGAFAVYGIAMYSIGLIIDVGLLLSYDSGLGDDLLLTLWDVSIAATPLMVLGFGGVAAVVGIGALAHRTRPSWYAGLSLLGGVSAILSLGMLVSDSDGAAGLGFVTFPLFMLWLIVSGVFLYREA